MTAHGHTTRTPVEEALSDARARYLAFLRRRVADPELAEDILQDALLRAFPGGILRVMQICATTGPDSMWPR